VTPPPFLLWLLLALATIFGLNAWHGFRTGYVGIDTGGARRGASPGMFWFGMVLSISGACYMTVLAGICLWRSL
jgi:hypothetical protein